MSTTNGQRSATRAALVWARPVVLLRYRPGVVGERGRMVHMMPLPGGGQTGAAGVALCGALLRPDLVEMITPGHGAPCTLCLVNHVSADPPLADTSASIPPADATSSDVRPLQAAVGYRAWGWPVTLRGTHVWLTLEPDTAALMIPVPLVKQVSTILCQRHCPPLVLSHPEVPGHRVVLAGEPYDVGLPWPPMVQRITGVFPLPPTVTCAGPVIWVHPPVADALRLCREVDVFAALRSALRATPI